MSTESFDQLSDVSDISSHHSDSDQDQMMVLVRRQKQLERERDAFVLITMILLAIYLVTVPILIRYNPNQTTEIAPIITNTTNTTDTFNPTEYMKTLGKRRMMRTSEILEDHEKVAKAQRVVESKGWRRIGDVPEYYWDKFMPDITRFEGVETYLYKTKQNGTRVEEALYFHPIKFWKVSEDGFINTLFEMFNLRSAIESGWPSLNHGIFGMVNVGSCDPKTECLQGKYKIEKGDLVFELTFTMEGGQKMIVKTVYYVPAETFI
ncbi:hypothetical protein GCK72_021633 [Caenorhabditis remanei]|uniref:Uncharacterized protein n=1 Tax=Caenorhabditis remanei TaxID=31234 RepID=E3N0G9_CAERE|nr:hypothetical protein GCK72_021633 [Caenorhabditis remanei]EFP13380.1 hypothetical protein CRE_11311 [Caenorhabditis remanei]KAF1755065.1 hypothetical protein GCK72_021633 [Caenorhabditis remanei]